MKLFWWRDKSTMTKIKIALDEHFANIPGKDYQGEMNKIVKYIMPNSHVSKNPVKKKPPTKEDMWIMTESGTPEHDKHLSEIIGGLGK